MIVRLSKQETKAIRRQLLTDVVYAISHDALKEMNPEYTELSPVEIYLSAQDFVSTINQLSDIDEGLTDEINDLIDETASPDEALLILVLAAIMLQAVDHKNPTQRTHDTIIHIFTRCQDNHLFMPLLEQFAHKEDARFAAGKMNNLMEYELNEIKRSGEGVEAVRTILNGILINAEKTDPDTIKGAIVLLGKFNIDNNHIIDDDLNQLYEKLGYKSSVIAQIQELVLNKRVENEVNGVAPGAIGIQNNK